jgi:hypothetical protein
MEKIIISGTSFNLVPMGISQTEKKRSFTISSELTYDEIEVAFSDVSNIRYTSEADEILKVFMDGISVKTISKDFENSTYIIEISIDAVEAELKQLRTQVAALFE